MSVCFACSVCVGVGVRMFIQTGELEGVVTIAVQRRQSTPPSEQNQCDGMSVCFIRLVALVSFHGSDRLSGSTYARSGNKENPETGS